MAMLGTIAFDEVRGFIQPRWVGSVELLETPSWRPAALVVLGTARNSSILFRGFFEVSPIYDLQSIMSSTSTATDQSGDEYSVLVVNLDISERPARCGGTLGKWVEVQATLRAWN